MTISWNANRESKTPTGLCSSEPTELDTLLKKIMDPNTQSELLDKPKLLTTSKRPRKKRKLNQVKPPVKPSYNPPIAE